jgi:hypothetical protein
MFPLTNIVKSTVFGVRNADKVVNGSNSGRDEGRFAATAGQFANALKEARKFDNIAKKGATAAIDAVNIASKNSKALDYALKGVKFASNHVNPLLCAAAGYRVLTADDKKSALQRETFGMSSMFAFERVAKKFLASNYIKNLTKHMPGGKDGKNAFLIITGLGFVACSIMGYSFGRKIGEFFFGKEKKKLPPNNSTSSQAPAGLKSPDSANKVQTANIKQIQEHITKLENKINENSGKTTQNDFESAIENKLLRKEILA